MADWYYYNASGEKVGPVRGRELKQLVLQGTVTQETLVEDANGHTARAKNVTGLPFSKTVQPIQRPSESSSAILPLSAGTDSSIISTAENLGEQDFERLRKDIERFQQEQERQQSTQNIPPPAVPPAEPNPFTAVPPVMENPFTRPFP